jgi:hypothetical protein
MNTHQIDTSVPLDGSDGNYHDPYADHSIDEMQHAADDALAAVKASGDFSPAFQNGLHAAGKGPASKYTSIEWWHLRYLYSSLRLSLDMKKKKAGL